MTLPTRVAGAQHSQEQTPDEQQQESARRVELLAERRFEVGLGFLDLTLSLQKIVKRWIESIPDPGVFLKK